MLDTSTDSRRLQESWQTGPRPSSVATPSAPAKLASEPPRSLRANEPLAERRRRRASASA